MNTTAHPPLSGRFAPDGALEIIVTPECARYVDIVQYLATIGQQEPEPTDPYQCAARFYSRLWNDLGHGPHVPPHELATVAGELADGDWLLSFEHGQWVARHADTEPGAPVQMAVAHAPRGGINIAGEWFAGGRFIPGKELAKATPEERAAIEADNTASKKSSADKRRSRGSVDVGKLKESLAEYAAKHDLSHESNAAHKRSAALMFHALNRHHGELTIHRLEELAWQAQKALDRLPGDEEGQRDYWTRELAKINHGISMAETRGHTGVVAPPEPAPRPESDNEALPETQHDGTIGDKKGGVSHDDDKTNILDATGTGSDRGGIPAGEPVGADAGTSDSAEPSGAGAGVGDRPAGVPASEDVGSDRTGEHVAGTGNGSAHGPRVGDESTAGGGAGGGGGAPSGPVEDSYAAPPTPENPTDVRGPNWRYTDRDFAKGGLKAKYNDNIAAIRTLRAIKDEGRDTATPAEQAVMSKYVGWGQFPALFNDNGWEREWKNERETLQGLLSEEEYKAAKKSILNAHYTHPDVVDAHWKMAQHLGFKGGRFLETSAGIGYYMGMMPEALAGATKTSAVELDSITGQMLKLLYPQNNVLNQGFEKHKAPDNFYDLVASNVPFGSYGVHDSRYNRHDAKIHDYFFLKSADLTRPGGLIMHITSAGTLDKADSKIRKELAKTCDFVGAIRFPAGSHKENAGTDVVTDMVILRKRPDGEAPVSMTETPTEALPPVKLDGKAAANMLTLGVDADTQRQIITAFQQAHQNGMTGKDATDAAYGTLKSLGKDVSKDKFKILAETIERAVQNSYGFTGITTDSLGRLYHWKDGVRVPGPGWTETTTIADPDGGEAIPVNKYFAEHPEHVLGQIDRTGTMYHGQSVSVSGITATELGQALGRRVTDRVEDDGAALDEDGNRATKKSRSFFDAETGEKIAPDEVRRVTAEAVQKKLAAVIDSLPKDLMKPRTTSKAAFVPDAQPAPGDVKDGGYTIKDGKLYVREGGSIVEQKTSAANLERIAAHLGVRDAVRAVINDQLNGRNATASRAELNAVYDAFVAKNGSLNSKPNANCFATDPDAPILLALENYDAKTKKATKADIFSKDTIRYIATADKAADVSSALGISLHEHGGVNIDRMAALLGKTPEQVGNALIKKGIAYLDPGEGWKPADQYLSGNVRKKLVMARAAAALDPKFNVNMAALEKVQPEDVDHQDIEARLGAPWIPPSDIKNFAAELLGASPEYFKIEYIPATGEWLVNMDKKHERVLYGQLGSQWTVTDESDRTRADLVDILASALSNKSIKIYDKVAGKSVLNEKATLDAAAKVQELKDAFHAEGGGGWIWEDEERRERLHRFYNDNFNNVRPMQYDGSHQNFPGMNPKIELRPHQKNFVWEVVTTGSALAAHEVGVGKTKAMVASAMELRRLGLARKPAIACMKANVEAIAKEAQDLYPGARILSTADMFDADSRKKTIARIATGDYDMVILTHDHLNLLQMKPETVKAYIDEELDELETMIKKSYAENPKKDNRVAKRLEDAKAKLLAKLAQALDESRKDDAVFFEETGIDQLFVDEAHKFKSLPVNTRQDRVKGIPTTRSDRATAMQMRVRWLQQNNKGRGTVFATGTPITNTLGELYNMQRYLQPDELKERGIAPFDAWANTFAEMDTKVEVDATGKYKPVSRLAKFSNLPELMQMSRQMMDVQRADDLKNPDGTSVITRPTRKDVVHAAPKTPILEKFMKELQERAGKLKGKQPGSTPDNMLLICTDGRKAATDMRLIDPLAADDPQSKTNVMVGNVLKFQQDNPGKTQCIFSDSGVNPGKSGFHLYADIIGKLVEGGIPRDKIADFSKLDGAKKEQAMDAMKRGEILVAIGSTDKLGTGVNVQDKLGALHHLDAPRDYTPASVEQRNGRGWRSGNANEGFDENGKPKPCNIHINTYVTEGSLDQFTWQLIANKDKFIKQILSPKGKLERTAVDDDAEELSYEQFKAASSGDPRIMEHVNLNEQVRNLRAAQNRHEREQGKLKTMIHKTGLNIPELKEQAAGYERGAKHFEENPDFSLTLDGKTYGERKDAAEAFVAKVAEATNKAIDDEENIPTRDYRRRQDWEEPVGTYRGMDVVYKGLGKDGRLFLRSKEGDNYPVGQTLPAVEYVARNLAKQQADTEARAAKETADLEKVKAKIGTAFPKAKELEEKAARLKQLEGELKGPGKEGEEKAKAKIGEAKPHADTRDNDHWQAVKDNAAAEESPAERHATRLVDIARNQGKPAADAEFRRIIEDDDLKAWEVQALKEMVRSKMSAATVASEAMQQEAAKPVEQAVTPTAATPEVVPAPPSGPVHHNTPREHNDIIENFGGKRINHPAHGWTTEFPSAEKLAAYQAHAAKAVAAAPPAAGAGRFGRNNAPGYRVKVGFDDKDKAKAYAKKLGGYITWDSENKTWWSPKAEIAAAVNERFG